MSRTTSEKPWNAWGEKNPFIGVLGAESADLTQLEVRASSNATGKAHIVFPLIDRVAPGSVLAVHMTVVDLHTTRRFLNAFLHCLPPLHWAYNLARKRPWDEPITEMNRYDLARLMSLMRGRYSGSLAIKDYDQNGHVGVMFIGRRA